MRQQIVEEPLLQEITIRGVQGLGGGWTREGRNGLETRAGRGWIEARKGAVSAAAAAE